MFAHWDNFFLTIGPSAAGLIGLIFVVSTLNAGRESTSIERGVRIYLSPVVFHLAAILLVSAIAEMPGLPDVVTAMVVGGSALAGLTVSVSSGWRMLGSKGPTPAHWTDVWFYAIGPGLAYVVLSGAAIIALSTPALAAPIAAAILLALLLLAIRNAWDLVTWLAPRRQSGT